MPRPTSPRTDRAAQRVLLPLLAPRHRPGRARLHRRHARRGGRDARPRRLDLTATLLARALGARECHALEGRARPPHRRSAHRARRARHSAAPRARGGGARLLRREGAAPARAHSARGPAHPAVRPSLRRPVLARHRGLGAGGPGAIPGEGALRRQRAGARHRRRQRHARRARHRGAHLRRAARAAVSVSLISQASSEHSICFSVPEAARGGRAREPASASSRRRSRRGEIDGVEVEPRHGDARRRRTRHARHAGRRGGRVLRARGRRASTSWPSRRDRRSSTSPSSSRPRQAAEAHAAHPRAPSSSRASPAARVDPARADGRHPARLRADRPDARRADRPACARPALSLRVAGVIDRSRLRVRSARDSARAGSPRSRGEAEGRPARATLPGGTPRRPTRRSRTWRATRSPGRCWWTSPPTRPRPRSSARSTHGMDLVLANKRPLAGRRA